MSRSSTSLVLVVVALLTAPLAGAANGAPTTRPAQAIRALTLRGQALNQTYHLGAYAGTVEASDPRAHPPRPSAQPDLPPRRVHRPVERKRSAQSRSAARRSTRRTTSARTPTAPGAPSPGSQPCSQRQPRSA